MLIRQTLLYLPSQLLGPSLQLLAMVLWTHILTPSDVGAITLFFAARDIILTITVAWWTSYTARYFAGEQHRGDYDATERTVVLMGGAVQSLALWVYFWATDYPISPALLAVSACQIVTESLVLHGTVRFRALGEIGRYTALFNLGPVVSVPLGLALTLVLEDKILAILIGYVAGQLLSIVATHSASAYFKTSGTFQPHTIPRAVRYSGPLVYGAVCAWVSLNSIRIILEREAGLEAVGFFSPGWSIGLRIIEVVSLMVTSAAFPLALAQLRERGTAGALDQIARNTVLLLAVMLPASVGLALIGPGLSGLLFRDGFAEMAGAVVPLAALYGFVRFFRIHFPDQSFLIFEQSHRHLALGTFDAVLTAVLCWVGLLWGGVVGAAAGILVAGVVSFVVSFILARRLCKITLPVGPTLKIVVATALMAGARLVLPAPVSPVSIAMFIAASGAIYAVALVLMFRSELREFFPGAAGKRRN